MPCSVERRQQKGQAQANLVYVHSCLIEKMFSKKRIGVVLT